MAQYNKPRTLDLNESAVENLRLFKQDVEIYFLATETNEKAEKV